MSILDGYGYFLGIKILIPPEAGMGPGMAPQYPYGSGIDPGIALTDTSQVGYQIAILVPGPILGITLNSCPTLVSTYWTGCFLLGPQWLLLRSCSSSRYWCPSFFWLPCCIFSPLVGCLV